MMRRRTGSTAAALTGLLLWAALAPAAPLQSPLEEAAPAPGASADPFVGTWHLQPARSHYASPDMPVAMDITMETEDGALVYRSHAVTADGRISDCGYRARYDEAPVIVECTQGVMAPVSLRRVGPRVVEATYARVLRVLATSRREIDAAGTTMTITTQTRDRDGNAAVNLGVYSKE